MAHDVVVIGAGIAGLSAAAALSRAGLSVTVLEAHVYPGGCAASFRYRGHWFDAGATLAAGFSTGGPMQLLGRVAGLHAWPVRPLEPAVVVAMDETLVVPRWSDERRWTTYGELFPRSLDFWRWQEATAAVLWDFALRLPELRPRSWTTMQDLLQTLARWLRDRRPSPLLALDLARPLAHHLPADSTFRRFVDAQLLIAAQALADTVYALYGAAALDLPNRGVVEVAGGIGGIARTLVAAIEAHGGHVLFRQEVSHLERARNGWRVQTNRGLELETSTVIANVTPWALARLWRNATPWFARRLQRPPDGWGAFVLYLSLDDALVPRDCPSHVQVLGSGPLGEGRSVFLSLSPVWDSSRAPEGRRVATISTHTAYAHWWAIAQQGEQAYREAVARYQERILETAARALPWLPSALRFALPGTPLAFARFVRRPFGWVGGFPQRHPFVGWPSELAPGLWLCGDSVFPGQSIPATALAGLRVARFILRSRGSDLPLSDREPHLEATGSSPTLPRSVAHSKTPA